MLGAALMWSMMAAAMSASRGSGRSWPILSNTLSWPLGSAWAVSSPAASGTSGSAPPWMTKPGACHPGQGLAAVGLMQDGQQLPGEALR